MELFDHKFREHKVSYISQCFLATWSVFTVLLFLDVMTTSVIIASLGASAFIAFAMPYAQSSRPRFMIGGYVVGTISGSLCKFLSQVDWMQHVPFIFTQPMAVFGAVAVGLAIFGMVITNTEHPPAATLALGIILNEWNLKTFVVVMAGICILAGLKTLLKPALRNLL